MDDYIVNKRRKIQDQRIDGIRLISTIFKGEVFWFDGLTETPLPGFTQDAIIRLVNEHGGKVINTNSSEVTIIICTTRTHAQKLKEEKTKRRKNLFILKPNWIIDCIDSRRKVDTIADYFVVKTHDMFTKPASFEISVGNLLQVAAKASDGSVVTLSQVVVWRGVHVKDIIQEGTTHEDAVQLIGSENVFSCSMADVSSLVHEVRGLLGQVFDRVYFLRNDIFIGENTKTFINMQDIEMRIQKSLEGKGFETHLKESQVGSRFIDKSYDKYAAERTFGCVLQNQNDLEQIVNGLVMILLGRLNDLIDRTRAEPLWELSTRTSRTNTVSKVSSFVYSPKNPSSFVNSQEELTRILVGGSTKAPTKYSKINGVALRVSEQLRPAPVTLMTDLFKRTRKVVGAKSKIELGDEAGADDSIREIKESMVQYMDTATDVYEMTCKISEFIIGLIRSENLFKARYSYRLLNLELKNRNCDGEHLKRIRHEIQTQCRKTYGADLKI